MPTPDIFEILAKLGFYQVRTIYLIAVAVLIVIWMLTKWDGKFWGWFDFGFLAATLLAILTNRAHFFHYAAILNPDEALFAANAMRSVFGWTNWGMIDPTTSGPLNSIVLTWPRVFGGDLTLYSGRLTAATIAFGTVGLIYATARRLATPAWAIAATLPAALFYVVTAQVDFVQFSSEQLPVFLIAGAIFFLISAAARPTLFNFAMGAALAGSIPFAKLQGLPWAALLGTALLLCSWLSREHRTSGGRLFGATVLFGSLPAVIFVAPLIATGDFGDFIKSYFVQQYLRGGPLVVSLGMLVADAATVVALMKATATFVLVSAALVLAFAAFVPSARKRPDLSGAQVAAVLLAVLALPAALVTVLLPARLAPHYLQFLIPALSLWTIAAASIVGSIPMGTWQARGAVPLAGYLAIMPLLPKHELFYLAHVGRSGGAFMTANMTSARFLSWLLPRGDDTLVCWGWRPECYVDSAMKSATRDGTNENQIYDTSLQPYFRSRFISDFEKARPDFVIDTISPGVFHFDNFSKQSIQTFPEFDRIVKSEFELVSKAIPIERCPRLYVRKTRLDELARTLVAFDSITGPSEENSTPRAVDDRITFETCSDQWLLPKGETGTLNISFLAAAKVKSVAILNTRGGLAGDRATGRIRLSLMDKDRAVATKEVALNRFPRWTDIAFDAPLPAANSLKVEVLSYLGAGGGLNEVKVYRDRAD
jgi:hypothetical protein